MDHVDKKTKVEEKEPKKLEDILKRFLESQSEVVELFIELFKRLEQPEIKKLWS